MYVQQQHQMICFIHSISWIWISAQSILTTWTTSWAGRWRTGSRAEEKLDRQIYRRRLESHFYLRTTEGERIQRRFPSSNSPLSALFIRIKHKIYYCGAKCGFAFIITVRTALYSALEWNSLSWFHKLVCESALWGMTSYSQTNVVSVSAVRLLRAPHTSHFLSSELPFLVLLFSG